MKYSCVLIFKPNAEEAEELLSAANSFPSAFASYQCKHEAFPGLVVIKVTRNFFISQDSIEFFMRICDPIFIAANYNMNKGAPGINDRYHIFMLTWQGVYHVYPGAPGKELMECFTPLARKMNEDGLTVQYEVSSQDELFMLEILGENAILQSSDLFKKFCAEHPEFTPVCSFSL